MAKVGEGEVVRQLKIDPLKFEMFEVWFFDVRSTSTSIPSILVFAAAVLSR